ncbi:hypothetical protein A2Z67_01815 [Candidatus Woesebacteria bacterium RBG_13_36_22]|uniref:Uncharacterized protein n=1 Tax=Candidatus Woesebacteria bacterium RBG_13_36_22 TaxID=1802478 RepID=A0A1F7X2F6_9BACT|nr:MAG: hypothetical protein A2Z67_01815 [Candidatus Woesebacteria bacterium RBG_13_36_22]
MKLLYGIIITSVVLIVIAVAFPVLWPLVTGAGGNITAMVGTDAGTTTVQAFWPIVLLLVGLGVAVGLIMYALKKFNVMS